MNSLPTIVEHKHIEQTNEQQLWEVVAKLDPELFLIKVALEETKVNPLIIPRYIRALANLSYGSGFGVVQTYISNNKLTQIKTAETDKVDMMTRVMEEVVV